MILFRRFGFGSVAAVEVRAGSVVRKDARLVLKQ
jgi:hypothetical protein